MSDGPFKNLKLTRSKKKFCQRIGNCAESIDDLASEAQSLIRKELTTSDNKRLFSSLQAWFENDGLGLDINSDFSHIFIKHPSSIFLNEVQYHLEYEVHNGLHWKKALSNAVRSGGQAIIHALFENLSSELHRVSGTDGNKAEDIEFARKRLSEVKRKISCDDIYDDLLSGKNKPQERKKISKNKGIDEGPRL